MEALQGKNKVFIIGFTNPGHATLCGAKKFK